MKLLKTENAQVILTKGSSIYFKNRRGICSSSFSSTDKTLLGLAVLVGFTVGCLVYNKYKGNGSDGDMTPPCPKKALDEEIRVLREELQKEYPNMEIPSILKPENNSFHEKIPYEIPTSYEQVQKPLKTVSVYLYDLLIYVNSLF